MNEHTKTVAFTQMKDGTRDEYLMLRELEEPFVKMTPDRILKALRDQADETLEGYKIDRLQHGLQSADDFHAAVREGPVGQQNDLSARPVGCAFDEDLGNG